MYIYSCKYNCVPVIHIVASRDILHMAGDDMIHFEQHQPQLSNLVPFTGLILRNIEMSNKSLHTSLLFKLFYETRCKICQNWDFVKWEWSLSVVGLRSSTHLSITRSSFVIPDWCRSIAWLWICCTEDVTKMSLIIVVWYDSGKNESATKKKKFHIKMMQIQYQYWRAVKSHSFLLPCYSKLVCFQ